MHKIKVSDYTSSVVLIPEYKIKPMDQSEAEETEFIIKAKGFPYDVTPTDLAVFFAGCDIKGGKHKGIHFVHSQGKFLLPICLI